MTRYNDQDMHPFEQFMLNCILSAILAGITFGVMNGAFDADLPGKAYWGLFVLWLLACYGFWFIFLRDNDNSSGGSGGSWVDDILP